MRKNPCLTCGACCAHFRVSFHWREAGDQTPGGVPVALTEDLTQVYRVMKGTNDAKPRCAALDGTVGAETTCTVYKSRPSPCRHFTASWSDGKPDERCDKARAAWGLPPLSPEDWEGEPDDDPEVPRPRRAA